jgi:RNA polymerase sigma factor (sigma-70 family)
MTARGATLGRIVRTAVKPARSPATDGDLLRQFAGGDQDAFAVLVRRHTGLVLSVCRRALPIAQDAEDACQATFLILARKARGGGRWQPSIANWLFTTARRVAGHQRRAAARRARREGRAAVPESVLPVDRMTGRELLAAIDEELDRLPPIYREPILLYYQEELGREEIATRLGIPAATVKTRLERGRRKLRDALTKRGLMISTSLLALMATSRAGASPPRLVEAIRATGAGNVPPAVARLAGEAAMNGVWKKLLVGAVLVVVAAALGFGVGDPRVSTAGQPPESPTPAKSVAETSKDHPPEDAVSYSGRVVDADGRPVEGATVRIVLRYGKRDGFEPLLASKVTDEDGRYEVSVPKAKLTDKLSGDEMPAMVLATAPGCFPGWTTAAEDGRILLARADTKVSGRVTDLEGRPVVGATIRVTAAYAPIGRTLDPWVEVLRRDRDSLSGGHLGPALAAELLPDVKLTAKTDAAGAFEIPGYAKDRVLHATIEGPTIATRSVGLLTRDVGPAALPAVSSGLSYYGTAGVISLKPSRPITGVVRDRVTGKPVAGVTVQSLMMAGSSRVESGLVKATSDKDGKFTLAGMPKGSGNKLLVVPGRGQPHLVTSVDVPDPNGFDPVAVDVTLERGILIEGVVRDPAGRPIPNVHVAYFANRFNDRVTHAGYGGRSGDAAPSDSDGKFRVVGLPGTGYLVAVGPASRYLSATERTGDGASETLQLDTVSFPARADGFHAVYAIAVPRNATEFRQDITLERGANLTVTVVGADGKIVAGCRSLSRRADDDWRHETRPGEHRVEGLNPRRPRIVLFRHAERNLVGMLSLPTGFTETTQRLVLQPGVTLVGRVLSDDGRPRAGVSVSLFVLPDRENPGDARRYRSLDEKVVTDAEGKFRVPALAPGFTYEVAVDGQFVSNSKFDVDKKATGTKDLGDLRLRLLKE